MRFFPSDRCCDTYAPRWLRDFAEGHCTPPPLALAQ
ncbi:hypothetical protein SYYSPA8_28245 [Streptomyces yaizuensis]|uniref:Uncharacterized protein n=1 Tax=Streptomyces yaizuensis TaxID=2989713 RepID=A0ABQ5P6P6_9ACTN|nr:hypothetical protein SYYSPA8_28245 [Streptomyces sp. YSPA8]